ncbi:MAG TPA: gamma-glutamyltransferase family protein [Hyphomicrobiaceae bacterium]|nr:gamma-glutamyltransferase family protein [Hyphomicrobiaceae bacterium]
MAVLPFTTRPEIQGTFGVVATTHWIASSVGMAVLERGGNAFDAAVAAGFTLQVAEPHLNGPGGDMPAIFYAKKDGRPRVLCAQGTSPGLATIEKFRELGLPTIPGAGMLATCVPGAFDGWLRLLQDYGTWRLRDCLSFAIGYAHSGIPVLPNIFNTTSTVAKLFREEWPTSAAVFLRNGNVPEVGSWFTNPALGATYERLLKDAEAASSDREGQIEAARNVWYNGWIAEAIDTFYTHQELMDPTGRRHKGLLRGDDMAKWRASYDEPAIVQYGGLDVYKCGFWSQGPTLLQQLSVMREMDARTAEATDPAFVHTVVEAAKLAFADREAWYGDPDFSDIPSDALLSEAYAGERRKLIGDQASMELRPGAPDGRTPDVSPAFTHRTDTSGIAKFGGVGEPTVQPTGEARGDTVHIDIIDTDGNMISVTPSGGWLQSAPVIPELGFPMGSRAQMFWLEEGTPSTLAPYKRPRTTLSPSLAMRNGEPYMVWGTPGGDQQDQWSTLLLLHHADRGMNLQEAIDTPAFHSEHWPSSFWPRGSTPGRLVVEGRMPDATVDGLKARGHDVVRGGDWSEGRLTAAVKDGKVLKAAANPRGMQGYAVGR